MVSSAAPGQLVAIDLPAGDALTEVVSDLWRRRISFLIVDPRLAAKERAQLMDRAQPSVLVAEDDEVLFADGAPVAREIAAVVATSGTAGSPRLAELTRAGLQHALSATDMALHTQGDQRWVACLPPAHVGGLLVWLRGIELGHPLLVHGSFDAGRLVEAAPAWASVVPTMVRRLVDLGRRLDGLSLLVGGGALDPDLRTVAVDLGASVVTSYGLTETTGGIAYDGRPLPGSEFRLDAADRLEVRGPCVMAGYRYDPQATARAFTLDGWLRTGDLGALGPDGAIEVYGRADDLIRSGSEKIWPAEVERVLLGHPKVADVTVAGLPDPEWGEHVTAWIVADGEVPTLAELSRHCRGRLASFKVPRELIVVDAIPRTGIGKVRRGELPRSPKGAAG